MTVSNIETLSSLSLFGEVELKGDQLKAIPDGILNLIKRGYARAVDRVISDDLSHTPLDFRTDEKGTIFIRINGGEEVAAGSLKLDPSLRIALRKALDIAKVHFPENFRPKEKVDFPSAPKVVDEKFSLVGRVTNETNCALAADLNSLSRNSLVVAKAASPAFVALSTLGSGAAAVYIAGKMMATAYVAHGEADKIGDVEGKTTAKTRAAIGANFGVFGTSMVAGYFTAAPVAAVALGVASGVGLIGMSASIMVKLYNEWGPLSDFRHELTHILDQEVPTLLKTMKGLEFLKNQFTLTQGEFDELPDAESMENKIKEKWAILVRRVGEETAKKIVNEVPDLIEGLKKGDELSVAKAIALLQEVDKSSSTNRTKQWILAFLSLVYSAVGILLLTSMASPLAPIVIPLLLIIGGIFWMAIDSERVGNFAGSLAWKSHHEERWYPKVENSTFKENMISAYRNDGSWNLMGLKAQIERDLARGTKIILNGEAISSFDTLIQKLRLQRLSFDLDNMHEKIMSESEIKALEFMTLIQQGTLGDAMALAIEKTYGEDYINYAAVGTSSPSFEATYNPDTNLGTLFTSMECHLKNVEKDKVVGKTDVKVYFDGNQGHHWFVPRK